MEAEISRGLAPSECVVYVARLSHLRLGHIAWLDEHEMARRGRFRMDSDRDRFTLAAVLLRSVVGRYIGRHRSAVPIDRTCHHCGEPHGRPRVAHSHLEVSISHSDEAVAVAVTRAGPVGIDIEAVAAREWEGLVSSVCAPVEKEFVRTIRDFYAFWTRKEAVLKATGQGLRTPMTDVVVTPPEAAPLLLALGDNAPPPSRMAEVEVPDGYTGATAVLTADPVNFNVVDARAILSCR